MTAYLMTEAQHAQIVEALDTIEALFTSMDIQHLLAYREVESALEMLKAMKPAEPVGYTDSRGRFFYKNDPHMIQDHSGMPELYALGDTA